MLVGGPHQGERPDSVSSPRVRSGAESSLEAEEGEDGAHVVGESGEHNGHHEASRVEVPQRKLFYYSLHLSTPHRLPRSPEDVSQRSTP